jgi:multiple sugar transport system ATP-binding protein
MSQVVFEGITKRFGDVVAVDHLDLDVVDGEFLVLLGPSGCGKTTALRMVAGLEAISEGTLRIGERVVNDIEAKDRDVAMVFQSYALYPHMIVAKNIESPLVARRFDVGGGERRRLTADERRERVAEAAKSLGLTPLLARKPAALSGGQRQRVALARAIVSRPSAFLMDEPLSNLDAKLRAETRLELTELHKRLGTTIIYVTHDQVEAMTMATRIALVDAGRLCQVGTPQEVYGQPANLFVARFLGSPPMNIFPATFGSGRLTVERAGVLELGATAPAEASRFEGAPVTVAVRPEHARIGGTDLRVRVTAVEWLGYERHVICRMGAENGAAGTVFTVREAAEGAAPSPGDEIGLGIRPEQVILFDPTTEDRIR